MLRTGDKRQESIQSHPWRSLPLCLLAVIATFLAGCSGEDPTRPYAEYLTRLGRALATEPVDAVSTALPRPPRPGQLRLSVSSDKLDALDFLALSGCEVQVTIGRRNSSLGRLARDSQRLLLELEYLRLAPACIEAMRSKGRDTLADQLAAAMRQKQQQLPALIFNATLASEEFRAFWKAQRSPGTYPEVPASTAVAALTAIDKQAQRWLQGDYRADNWAFEIHLSEVAGGPGGAVVNSLMTQQAWLAAADQLLQSRMARGPLCAPEFRHRGADILPNVVQRYFIQGIQPRAAVLERQRFELLPPLHSLEQQLSGILPADYLAWAAHRDTLIDDAAGAPSRHVAQLQDIQSPCGQLLPAQSR